MVRTMVEILRLTKYPWTRADGKRVTMTQVTYRDRRGRTHIEVLEGDLDLETAERRLKRR